jgi:hypothetical protein
MSLELKLDESEGIKCVLRSPVSLPPSNYSVWVVNQNGYERLAWLGAGPLLSKIMTKYGRVQNRAFC